MTNNKQQTAVDWLYNELTTKSGVSQQEWAKMILTAFSKAKEMEKEQIMNAFSIGEVMATDYFYGEDNCAINYYNETYGGNK
jgi:hypothetical protein